MRGFTLLETLIYIALFSVLMTGFVTAATAIGEAGNRIAVFARYIDEETFLLQRLRQTAEYANDINVSDTQEFGTKIAFDNGLHTTSFLVEADHLIEERTMGRHTLTGKGIHVSDLTCDLSKETDIAHLGCAFELSILGGTGALAEGTSTISVYPFNL